MNNTQNQHCIYCQEQPDDCLSPDHNEYIEIINNTETETYTLCLYYQESTYNEDDGFDTYIASQEVEIKYCPFCGRALNSK